ncbi:hypothetical protein EPN83_00900, partial [Patescibacteria group bacterium]
MISFNPEKKSPLLAFIKFEPTFLTVLRQFAFPLRFPPIGRAGKARRAEGGCGGNSARRAQPVPFGYFQT